MLYIENTEKSAKSLPQPDYRIPFPELARGELKPGESVFVLQYRSYTGPKFDFLAPAIGTAYFGRENLDSPDRPGRVGLFLRIIDETYRTPQIASEPLESDSVYKIYNYDPLKDENAYRILLDHAKRVLKEAGPTATFERIKS